MAEFNELYQAVILEHNKKPRNFRKPEHTTREQEGYNPLCGDQLTVYLEMDGDAIKDIGFEGQGCAISKASASLMTVAVKGKSKPEAEQMFSEFHRMVKGELDPEEGENSLGRLKILSGVREYPARVKCASLCWHTLHAALEGEPEPVSTE